MNEKRYRFFLYGLMAIFLLKALAVAFFVTPRWDVPDETGHFAYIEELRSGNLPILGQSVIPESIVRDWKGSGSTEPNWIAQHPPLYHLAAIPFVAVAEATTTNQNLIFRSPRILSALLGTATLYALFASLTVATGRRDFAVMCATLLAFTPMFTHLSAGTNHDVAVALLACLALRELALAHAAFNWTIAYRLALILAAGGAVKLSTVPVTIAILFLLILTSRSMINVAHSMAVTAIALAPPALWVMRNYAYTGSSQLLAEPKTAQVGPLGFFTTYPVIEHTLKNFIGLIGWTGSGHGELRWLQIGGVAFVPFLLLTVAISAAATIHYVGVMHAGRRSVATITALLWLTTMLTLLFNLPRDSAGIMLKSAACALLFSIFAFALLLLDRRNHGDVSLASIFVVALFTSAFGLRIWNAFLATGTMRATHGRYFYAALPFLALALVYPAFRVAEKHRLGMLALIVAPLLAVVGEGWFYLHDVVPFFRK